METDAIRLRALEPEDVETLYRWENDPEVWRLSGTMAPFSKYILRQFIESQRHNIYETGQLRLIIEEKSSARAVGAIDLFEIDPYNRRAGVGVLIHDRQDRRQGHASDALAALTRYAFTILGLNQLWCNIPAHNLPSLALFKAKGFTIVGLKKEWIKTTSDYQDEYLLQLINPVK